VGVYVFDLLYANGEVLVQLPLCERQDRLKQVRSWGHERTCMKD
jgi:ATP-dependent DNA ligase